MLAARRKKAGVIKQLLKAGADPSIQSVSRVFTELRTKLGFPIIIYLCTCALAGGGGS